MGLPVTYKDSGDDAGGGKHLNSRGVPFFAHIGETEARICGGLA
jgi:hypothetical protein